MSKTLHLNPSPIYLIELNISSKKEETPLLSPISFIEVKALTKNKAFGFFCEDT